jgi:hypothetical protein
VRRIIFAVPVLASITALPAEAEMFGPGFQPCGDNLHTRRCRVRTGKHQRGGSAVACSLQGAANSDRHRSTSTVAGGATAVVQYRDANCGFYGTQDGSIGQVQGAECIRSMTEDRAHELEKAMKLD